MTGTKIVFGAGSFTADGGYGKDKSIEPMLDSLLKEGVTTIDTAQLYGESETLLGQAKAGDKFTLDTKAPGGFGPMMGKPDCMHRDMVKPTAEASMKTLGVKSVDVFYIHAPDPKTPLADQLYGINEAHQAGLFKRFGLSNYKASDVRTIHAHCKENSYVLPTVYQGNYNPVARKQETILFPTLRELGISFYAYSPLAGGFLTKTRAQIEEGAGRFSNDTTIGKMYNYMYARPSYLSALSQWSSIASEEDVSPAELAYRWVAHNSPLTEAHGDGIVIGARDVGQLEGTVRGIKKGKLSAKAVKGIDDVWKTIEHEAPVDNLDFLATTGQAETAKH